MDTNHRTRLIGLRHKKGGGGGKGIYERGIVIKVASSLWRVFKRISPNDPNVHTYIYMNMDSLYNPWTISLSVSLESILGCAILTLYMIAMHI